MPLMFCFRADADDAAADTPRYAIAVAAAAPLLSFFAIDAMPLICCRLRC